MNPYRLSRQVLSPGVGDLNGDGGLRRLDAVVIDQDVVSEPPRQRLADRELHRRHQNRVTGLKDQVEEPAAKLRQVDSLAGTRSPGAVNST